MPYHGKDHNDYVNGAGFCCEGKDKKLQTYGGGIGKGNEEYEKMQYYYHADHLGSSSYITNLDAQIVKHVEYVPFWEVLIEERNQSWNTPYLFNGKELDEETGLYYYGARYYNPRESIFLSMDPMFEKTGTPYQYTYQNPIRFTDPTGMEANPIYDENGNFLGTDNRGLQGEAIIMNKDNFSQGMSHEEAKSKGTLLSNYNVESDGKGGLTEKGKYQAAVFDRINMHSLGLKNRPDYDGFLTLSEANDWYRNGGGSPLFVNSALIDLFPVTLENVNQSKNGYYFNFFLTQNTETGLVYGSIKITLMDKKNGIVRLGDKKGLLDTYDFDIKPSDGTLKRAVRNIGTRIGKFVAGEGTPFDIYTYGTAKLKSNSVLFKPNAPILP
ncbi:RHS repeat domain-containing protein [Apibacter adventoris]|uniref:RHS repeat domain-containing protein n=1 Tax=Apibacter adventoris TaxID=1679466 RepID=UPI0021A7B7B5|nr:RHS repeat-associated core domain-containing protein [Apibacter adventoris]